MVKTFTSSHQDLQINSPEPLPLSKHLSHRFSSAAVGTASQIQSWRRLTVLLVWGEEKENAEEWSRDRWSLWNCLKVLRTQQHQDRDPISRLLSAKNP
ncbi:hypothetical protein Q7C36_022984 [Tachysurus vachellii]|uniref:Uncharacterized protein n=1 Tax=Tachysurus vachellii TaxID=175792 RepID=A0AA88IQ23_TACVA|nr:hypothetical protein Q7C36_022984 [Tachysurus vachellii]